MRFVSRISLFIVFWSLAGAALADTLKGPAEARALTDQVMSKVGAGDIEGGIKLTRPYLIIPAAEFDVMVEQMRMQLPALSQRFGKSIGHEYVGEDKLGAHLLRVVQLHRFERHVMRWSFYFYEGKDGWVLDTFKTEDDIRQFFPH